MATEDGPWLFGRYTLADAFFAPVAARIVGYDLQVSAAARAYCTATITDPAFRAWRVEALKVRYDPPRYIFTDRIAPWPGDDSAHVNLS